ncbi:MAG: hypothetical protein D6714_08350 [Bacteroidetes bacterium]|nr:MAG: hypothetical protein D6714_08350 [Bacteroidota bacterium]
MGYESDEIKGLEEQLELLLKKANLLEKKLILEDDPTRMLKYEVDKEETEVKIAQVKKKLTELKATLAPEPQPAGSEATRVVFHEYHRYTCNRQPQNVQFHSSFRVSKDKQKTHFFYMYGLNVQSPEGLFYRFSYDLEGRLLDYLNPDLEKDKHIRSVRALLTPQLSPDETYNKQEVLKNLFAALSVPYAHFEPLLKKRLEDVCLSSPTIRKLGPEDYVCIFLGVSSFDWDKEKIPALAHWFITRFCACTLPEDAPTFLFFLAIIYEEDDPQIRAEVKETVENSDLIIGLPELGDVSLQDVKRWFFNYQTIFPNTKTRQQLIEERFGDAQTFEMEEVEIRLERIIDEYNKGHLED